MKNREFKTVLRMLKLVSPLKWIMLLTIIFGVLGFLSSMLITILATYGVLSVLNLININLINLFVIMITLAIIRGGLRYFEQSSGHYIAFKLLALIRDKVFKTLRKLAPAKLECKNKGDLIATITTDIELLEVFYAHTIAPVAIAIIISIILSVFIATFNIFLGLVAFIAYLTVGTVVPIIFYKKSKIKGEQYRDKFSDFNNDFLENIRGIREIQNYNYDETIKKNIDKKSMDLHKSFWNIRKHESNIVSITDLLVILFSVIILVLGLLLNLNGKISFIQVIIPTIVLFSSFGPVIALSNLSNNLLNTFAAAKRVFSLLDEQPITKEISNGKDVLFEDIKCDNICFKYGDKMVLNNFNFRINKGECIGIMGESGCGKSTFLRLLMRFWDIDSGTINISSIDIKDINTNSLRDIEGLATQQTFLFNDTILNNLKIVNQNATYDEIVDACKKASVHGFIEKLEKGYETNVGELGDKLSGGEIQRIGIARLFLHNSNLILLDEPTSNLDSLNESIILNSLFKEKSNKTMIMVSHKKSSLNVSDKILKI